ncbi:MAG: hypothetical protein AAGE92_00570 [Cyanobacteria bacterium P01_G01_bin.4]
MKKPLRLQFVFQCLPPNSIDALALEYLLDRERISASASRERVLEALAAWFIPDALLDELARERDGSTKRFLMEAIASLESRTAYCRSLLNQLDSVTEADRVKAVPVVSADTPPVPAQPPTPVVMEQEVEFDLSDAGSVFAEL